MPSAWIFASLQSRSPRFRRASTGARYLIAPGSVEPRGSFAGFECRWQDIPSRHGETVSLMVLALHHEPERAAVVYREVIGKVRETYGDEDVCHPVSLPQFAMTLNGRLLADEAGVRSDEPTAALVVAYAADGAGRLGIHAFRCTHCGD